MTKTYGNSRKYTETEMADMYTKQAIGPLLFMRQVAVERKRNRIRYHL